MARTEVELTGTYQSLAIVPITITVKENPDHNQLFINDVASDVAAHVARPINNDQFLQTSTVATFAKGVGITVIVDDGT